MKSLINQFIDHLSAEGKSQNTIKAYRRDLSSFADSTACEMVELGTSDIDVFANEMRSSGKSPSTVNRTMSAVKSFCAWAVDQELIQRDPSRSFKIRRTDPKPRQVLSDSEKAKLLKTLRMSREPEALRDWALFHLILSTGIRVSEAANLDLSDISDEKHIIIKAKGDKLQQKFLGAAIRGTMRIYLKERRTLETKSPALFLGRNGRISVRQIQNRLSYWAAKAGIKTPITPHSLRHTFATELLKKTSNVRLVQTALGHSSIETTMIYTHLSDDALAEAVENL